MNNTTATKATIKTVHVLARYVFNATGHIVYKVRANAPLKDGEHYEHEHVACDGKRYRFYCTTIINGKATACTCDSRKPCYHMTQLEAIEAARVAKAAPVVEAAPVVVATIDLSPIEIDLWSDPTFNPWAGLTAEQMREAYCAEFAIY